MFLYKKKKILILIMSLILAVGITFFEYNYFSNMVKKEKMIEVIVADSNIPIGAKVDGIGSVKNIPSSAYIDDMLKADQPVSGYAKVNISKGSYILSSMIQETNPPIIKDGMRRVTIGVNIVSALAGKIKAGDYVDIGFIPKNEVGDTPERAEIVAVNVQVYNVVNNKAVDIENEKEKKDNQYDKDSIIPAAVTLIVTPEQAVTIKDLESKGNLFLMGY